MKTRNNDLGSQQLKDIHRELEILRADLCQLEDCFYMSNQMEQIFLKTQERIKFLEAE